MPCFTWADHDLNIKVFVLPFWKYLLQYFTSLVHLYAWKLQLKKKIGITDIVSTNSVYVNVNVINIRILKFIQPTGDQLNLICTVPYENPTISCPAVIDAFFFEPFIAVWISSWSGARWCRYWVLVLALALPCTPSACLCKWWISPVWDEECFWQQGLCTAPCLWWWQSWGIQLQPCVEHVHHSFGGFSKLFIWHTFNSEAVPSGIMYFPICLQFQVTNPLLQHLSS